jgi:hypothetical protein
MDQLFHSMLPGFFTACSQEVILPQGFSAMDKS